MGVTCENYSIDAIHCFYQSTLHFSFIVLTYPLYSPYIINERFLSEFLMAFLVQHWHIWISLLAFLWIPLYLMCKCI